MYLNWKTKFFIQQRHEERFGISDNFRIYSPESRTNNVSRLRITLWHLLRKNLFAGETCTRVTAVLLKLLTIWHSESRTNNVSPIKITQYSCDIFYANNTLCGTRAKVTPVWRWNLYKSDRSVVEIVDNFTLREIWHLVTFFNNLLEF